MKYHNNIMKYFLWIHCGGQRLLQVPRDNSGA